MIFPNIPVRTCISWDATMQPQKKIWMLWMLWMLWIFPKKNLDVMDCWTTSGLTSDKHIACGDQALRSGEGARMDFAWSSWRYLAIPLRRSDASLEMGQHVYKWSTSGPQVVHLVWNFDQYHPISCHDDFNLVMTVVVIVVLVMEMWWRWWLDELLNSRCCFSLKNQPQGRPIEQQWVCVCVTRPS